MKRIEVAGSSEVQEGKLFLAKVEDLQVLLTRVGGTAYAVENKCAHLGFSMARGSVEGATLRCPWHGSRFDVCTGRNVDWVNAVAGVPMPGWMHKLIALGKEPAPIRTFEVSEEAGQLFIHVPA